MTERTMQTVQKETADFYTWLDNQAFIHGPKYNRSIVSFSYGPRINKECTFEQRIKAEQAYYEGDDIGEVSTRVTTTESRGYIDMTYELLDKIAETKAMISDKYRYTVMPLIKEQRILELQRSLERDKKRAANHSEGKLSSKQCDEEYFY